MNEKEIEKLFRLVEPNDDDIAQGIEKRIRHRTFARALICAYVIGKRDGFIYPKDLAKVLKNISTPRAWQILNEMERFELVKRTERGGDTVFILNLNNIEKWVEKAKEVLLKRK
jgi:hypothetical protein